jgi:hypothetical protein
MLGVLAVVDVAGASITPSAYPAIALTAVGLGLVLGAWFGRARLLILLGVALSIGLLGATADSSAPQFAGRNSPPMTIVPASVAEMNPSYSGNGDLVLDLSNVDFTGQHAVTDVSMNIGSLLVILPPTVDVEVHARVGVGEAVVLQDEWSGANDKGRTVVDNGADGPGGGNLILTVNVRAGHLEVTR